MIRKLKKFTITYKESQDATETKSCIFVADDSEHAENKFLDSLGVDGIIVTSVKQL